MFGDKTPSSPSNVVLCDYTEYDQVIAGARYSFGIKHSIEDTIKLKLFDVGWEFCPVLLRKKCEQ